MNYSEVERLAIKLGNFITGGFNLKVESYGDDLSPYLMLERLEFIVEHMALIDEDIDELFTLLDK